MIYITFFIVILIDKRGVREAERETERETSTPSNTGTNTGTNTERYTTATTAREKRQASSRQNKRGMTTQRHRSTPPRGSAHARLEEARTRAFYTAHAHTRTKYGRTGACRRGLGERHTSVTTPEMTCDHQPLHPP